MAALPSLRAELLASGWELFSALLFASAFVPAALTTPWPALILVATFAISAALGPSLRALRSPGYTGSMALRMLAWTLAVAPLARTEGPRGILAGASFGLMAGVIRGAIYRAYCEPRGAELDDATLAVGLRARLSEAAAVAGVLGGHLMLLFAVAFLRTRSQLIFQAWFEVVPGLGLLATGGFTLAVRPMTRAVLAALAAGPGGDPALLARGLAEARRVSGALAYRNFAVWWACLVVGVLWIRPGPAVWKAGDAVMQLAFGSLFALGVAVYQRAWNREALGPVVERLGRWTAATERRELISLRARMLRDFGLPLLFTAALSLLASVGLYRALGTQGTFREDFNAISALIASFAILVIAVGSVVVRAAGDLSRPMVELGQAADRVASGHLEAAVPRVAGPVEVVGLGESIERMRQGLSRTIAELEEERAGLEAKVDARTAELRRTLAKLKEAQAALIQGERLASIGELVAGVAHEINNPLNAIAGAAVPLEELAAAVREMIDAYREAEAELSPERRRALAELRARLDLDDSLADLRGIASVIRRGTDRAVRIVQNLRNFSRAPGEAAPTDLHVGLEETLMLLAPRLRHGTIRVERRFGELPEVVCRGGEMNQVFMNLLVNAIQAVERAKEGEAVITVETRLDGDTAVVSVSDNGPGVPESLGGKVFDPFFTTKPRGQGTGLGLSISTDIARRHGGTLALEQPSGGGARFVVRVPIGSAIVG